MRGSSVRFRPVAPCSADNTRRSRLFPAALYFFAGAYEFIGLFCHSNMQSIHSSAYIFSSFLSIDCVLSTAFKCRDKAYDRFLTKAVRILCLNNTVCNNLIFALSKGPILSGGVSIKRPGDGQITLGSFFASRYLIRVTALCLCSLDFG